MEVESSSGCEMVDETLDGWVEVTSTSPTFEWEKSGGSRELPEETVLPQDESVCDERKSDQGSDDALVLMLGTEEPRLSVSPLPVPTNDHDTGCESTADRFARSERTVAERDLEIIHLRRQLECMSLATKNIFSLFTAIPPSTESTSSRTMDELPTWFESLPEDVQYECGELWQTGKRLSRETRAAASTTPVPPPQISFMQFKIGDVALFMPAFVDDRRIWMAFNSGAPHYFLSEDSLLVFLSKSRNREKRSSIIGRLIYFERLVAVEDNQYRLPVGMEYHVCHAEPLYRQHVFPQQLQQQHQS